MSDLSSQMTQRIDIFDPSFRENPYPAYARLRESGPACRGTLGQWMVPRYADVARLLRDPRLGKQLPGSYYQTSAGAGAAASFLYRINQGRSNRDIARAMAHAFGPGFIQADEIARLADKLLSAALKKDRFDVVTDLAHPLPGTIMCRILGIPGTDQATVLRHAAALAGTLGNTLVLPEKDRVAADEAVQWLREYVAAMLDERTRTPHDDLLTRLLVATRANSAASFEHIVDNAIVAFHAGFETTSGMIANGCVALLNNPDEMARVRANPGLIPVAVDEILRYDAPIQMTMRIAEQPIEIGNHVIKKGRILVLLIGSANHDGEAFEDPDRFDVGRTPNSQLSFGGGIYRCLAGALAKAQGEAAFRQLLLRCPVLEFAGAPVRSPRFTLRTYESIPVTAYRAAN